MPDLTLPVILWWIGTMVACLLLGMALMAIWFASRRTARVLRVVDVAPERIARVKATGAAAGRAVVMRGDGLAATNMMMAAVDSPLPGLIGADHPPLAMTSVIRAEDLGDYAYITAGEVDDPDAQVLVAGLQQPVVLEPDPGEPFDVEEVEDEPERPGPPPRLDDDRPGGGGTPAIAAVPAPAVVQEPAEYRHSWPTWTPGAQVDPARVPKVAPGVLPKGWMLRASRHAREQAAAVRTQAPITVRRLARHVVLSETVTALRAGLADWRTGMDRWWEQWSAGQNPAPVGVPRLPQSLLAPVGDRRPVTAVVGYRAGGKPRGRHRTGVAAGTETQQRVSA